MRKAPYLAALAAGTIGIGAYSDLLPFRVPRGYTQEADTMKPETRKPSADSDKSEKKERKKPYFKVKIGDLESEFELDMPEPVREIPLDEVDESKLISDYSTKEKILIADALTCGYVTITRCVNAFNKGSYKRPSHPKHIRHKDRGLWYISLPIATRSVCDFLDGLEQMNKELPPGKKAHIDLTSSIEKSIVDDVELISTTHNFRVERPENGEKKLIDERYLRAVIAFPGKWREGDRYFHFSRYFDLSPTNRRPDRKVNADDSYILDFIEYIRAVSKLDEKKIREMLKTESRIKKAFEDGSLNAVLPDNYMRSWPVILKLRGLYTGKAKTPILMRCRDFNEEGLDLLDREPEKAQRQFFGEN